MSNLRKRYVNMHEPAWAWKVGQEQYRASHSRLGRRVFMNGIYEMVGRLGYIDMNIDTRCTLFKLTLLVSKGQYMFE